MRLPDQEGDRKELLKNKIHRILFSGGTYQIEVEDPRSKERFWPFLQLDESGEIQDAFCTCPEAEQEQSCPHLEAALLTVQGEQPLHQRYEDSFWNKLCLMAFKRHGDDVKAIKKKGEDLYAATAQGGELLFSLKLKSPQGKETFEEILFHRPLETEETSLKFSNLPSEELALWKRGTPSQAFQYELSYWSDFAKWMFLQEEFQRFYSISFHPDTKGLPKRVFLTFEDAIFEFYIAKVNWKELIPSLKQVNSPLKVHEFRDIELKKITYDSKQKELHLLSQGIEHKKREGGILVDEWEYFPQEGFFPANEPSYELYFDEKKGLHIVCYAFSKGDLEKESSECFEGWVYLKEKGFYPFKEMRFPEIHTVVPSEKVGDFISTHRLWLNEYEGFQLHLSNVEFRMSYTFDLDLLLFQSESARLDENGEILDFGDWLYMKGKGFYRKVLARGQKTLLTSKAVRAHEIPLFFQEHREELEQIKHFFSPSSPLEKAGLNLSIDEMGNILSEPSYFFRSAYKECSVHFFGPYTYVKGEGFCLIPPLARLPDPYRKKVQIPPSKEAAFIAQLPKLTPFILKIDRRLRRPHHLTLQIQSIEKTKDKKWNAELTYKSELGEATLEEIKEAMLMQKSYAKTEAGLLSLKDPRFNWLREAGQVKQNHLSLSTLQWIRLKVFENIEIKLEASEKGEKIKACLEEIDRFETEDCLSLRGLKSTLRPYQEIGVKWLWFLYSYGLSGLLCDDMGLGKTHQAMALMAAVKNGEEGRRPRFFIICPTSVLYHWEDLLTKFLPNLSLFIFYGAQRSLSGFQEHADLLLTSYGTLRSERKELSKIAFDVAIFDEVQIAKNGQSQTHHALSMIQAKTKIGLSGTPIENRLLELKALFDLVLPGYMPPHHQYRDQFIHPIEKFQDAEKRALLSRLIHPFMLRRKKREVLQDLPEKIEEIAYSFLSEEQKVLYDQTLKSSRDLLIHDLTTAQEELPYMHIFALLNRLKQICNHPCLINKDFENYKKYRSGKWELFVELLEEVRGSGQKVVVFSQYLEMLSLIERYLKEQNIQYATIRGSTVDRREQLEKFKKEPECIVFVASLKAAGTGVDLTAASVVIHYDRWWNPAKENQATDRVHRIGQNRGVQVFKMVNKESIEEQIHALIERKISLTEGVIGYDDKDQIKTLSREDLLDLLKNLSSPLN